MKTLVIAFATLGLLVAAPAFANHNNGNGQDDCEAAACNNNGGGPGDPGPGGDVNVDVTTVAVGVGIAEANSNAEATASSDATATAVQGQEQGQAQFQAQGNVQKLTIEDAANPASSAANLYLANCSSGASAQGFGGGGSVGGPDEVCLLLNASQVAFFQGDFEQASDLRGIAVKILKERTNSLLRFLQMLPVVRRVI